MYGGVRRLFFCRPLEQGGTQRGTAQGGGRRRRAGGGGKPGGRADGSGSGTRGSRGDKGIKDLGFRRTPPPPEKRSPRLCVSGAWISLNLYSDLSEPFASSVGGRTASSGGQQQQRRDLMLNGTADPLLPSGADHQMTETLAIDRARHAFRSFLFGVAFGIIAIPLGVRTGASWTVLWACGYISLLLVKFLIYRFLREWLLCES
jgi:hypothetical protein